MATECLPFMTSDLEHVAHCLPAASGSGLETVCVRMERFSYSNTLGWNTFPVPKLTEKNKDDLTRCAEDILLAREAHFPATHRRPLRELRKCPPTCALPMIATTRCLSASTSVAASATTPSGWKSSSSSTPSMTKTVGAACTNVPLSCVLAIAT